MKHQKILAFGSLLLAPMLFSMGTASFSSLSRAPVSSLAAQASGAVTGLSQSELNGVKKRADDLLIFLEDLAKKLDALPNVSPQMRFDDIQFTGTGERAGRAAASFGLVALFETGEQTFQIINKPKRPITFVELGGLAAPFGYKGGTFPGTGGTCQRTIATDCTIVLTYMPNGVDGALTGEFLRNQINVKLAFLDGTSPKESVFLVIGGMVQRNFANELSVQIEKAADSVLPGEESSALLRIGLPNTSDTRPVTFKDVSVSGLTTPFAITRNTCTERAVTVSTCHIELSFKPTVSGIVRQDIATRINTGAGTPTELKIALSATALLLGQGLSADKNLLVVYDEDWQESVEMKNYYIANRPGFASANTLGIHIPVPSSCATIACLAPVIEVLPYPEIRDRVITPVVSWLRQHPEKDITYIVFMRGVPNRPNDESAAQYEKPFSVQEILRQGVMQALSKEVFVSSLDIGSSEATRAYVNKLKTVHASMSVPSPLISARGTPYGGDTYYFNDSFALGGGPISVQDFVSALKTANPSASVVYKKNTDSLLTTASNVTALEHGGIYKYGSDNVHYATKGSIRLSGRSSWWLAQTIESYNGQWLNNFTKDEASKWSGPWWANGSQGNFIEWFSSNAYGGSNYSNTPVAAVTHVMEPNGPGNGPALFTCWEASKPFAYCAWRSNQTIGGQKIQVIGDPWVAR